MSWKWSKTVDEAKDFWQEVWTENRKRPWTEAHHVWVDFWVSLFSMSYTLGHIVGVILIPGGLVWLLIF